MREELAKEGFGILTEINVQDKFKEKLGRDFREYLILGACNPALAWEAFAKEINIGTLLPCNVVVYRDDDNNNRGHDHGPGCRPWRDRECPNSSEIAAQVRARMERVLAAL